MPYCDYIFYSTTFHGRMSEAEFDKNAIIAQSYLDAYTRHKIHIDTLTEDLQLRVKLCLCELCDNVQLSAEHHGVASESIGNLSVSYSLTNESALKTALDDIIARWLGDTDLLYMLAWV